MTTYSNSEVPEPALITAAKAAGLDHIPAHFSFGDGVQTGTFPVDTDRVEIRKFAVGIARDFVVDEGELIETARKIAEFVEAG